jgi:hypothetical protein
LKHESSLSPLRFRGIERVRLHADRTSLAKLSGALARARAVPLAAEALEAAAAAGTGKHHTIIPRNNAA